MKKTNYLLPAILLLACTFHLNAQTTGCTDPLANNFNAAATINDGSCLYNNASIAPVSSVNLSSLIDENSGAVIWNDLVWTHNDNSDKTLYGIDTLNGTTQNTYLLSGITNVEWEDISRDSNYLYIGDFGNNANGNRQNLRIYRVSINSLLNNNPVCDTINFSYSDQTNFNPTGANNTDFDCEALIVTTDSIFLFTKQWVSEKTALYALPKTPGTHIAQWQATLDVNGLITGSTFVENKNVVALCGYSGLMQPFLYLLYDYQGSSFFSGNKRKLTLTLPFHQVEGIATTNGLKYYVTNEHFSQPPIINNLQKLHVVQLDNFLSTYLAGITTGLSVENPDQQYRVYPNPAKGIFTIETDRYPVPYRITDLSGRILFFGEASMENNTVAADGLSGGVYYLYLNHKHVYKLVLQPD